MEVLILLPRSDYHLPTKFMEGSVSVKTNAIPTPSNDNRSPCGENTIGLT